MYLNFPLSNAPFTGGYSNQRLFLELGGFWIHANRRHLDYELSVCLFFCDYYSLGANMNIHIGKKCCRDHANCSLACARDQSIHSSGLEFLQVTDQFTSIIASSESFFRSHSDFNKIITRCARAELTIDKCWQNNFSVWISAKKPRHRKAKQLVRRRWTSGDGMNHICLLLAHGCIFSFWIIAATKLTATNTTFDSNEST